MEKAPIFHSKEVIRKFNETRKRVDDLRVNDSSYDDSVRDLAQEEEADRNFYKTNPSIDELANYVSNKSLRAAEAEKKDWKDELTGLRNKRALKEEIPGQLGLAKRNEKNVAVLMIDFDYFKRVNDEIGHLAGDQALKIVADIIRTSIRKTDLVYRFGGEEFTVFLMNTTMAESQEIAEKIRENIEAASIVVLDKDDRQHTLKKTASIGCVGTDQLVSWNDDVKDDFEDIRDELIAKADAALYHAKESGRNRVVLYDDSSRQGE